MLAQNSRAAGRYQIKVIEDPSQASGLRLCWKVLPEWEAWAVLTEGTYIQLTEAEAAFRIHKSDLSIRPIWHQKSECVQAHILICFLAFVLWKTLEQW